MKLHLHLLFLIATMSIYNAYALNSEESNGSDDRRLSTPNVNSLIGKILKARRFNELADKISDVAIEKFYKIQKLDPKGQVDKENTIHRSPKPNKNTNQIKKPRGQKSHNHSKINVDAVLRNKYVPLDNLKLRYKDLKLGTSEIKSQEENKDDQKNSQPSISSEKKDYKKIAQALKTEFDDNIQTRDDHFENPFGDEKHIPWRAISDFTGEENVTTAGVTMLNYISEPTTRIEGNVTYIFKDSPDYKEYHEQKAKIVENNKLSEMGLKNYK